MFGSAILLLAVGLAAGYSLGWAGSGKLIGSLKNDQADKKNQIRELTSQLNGKQTTNDTLARQLNDATSRLDAVFQSTRQVALTANQAERVAVGAFTVGLGTALGSNSVSVNIDGKRQDMTPGDSQNLAFNCHIQLQSFDILQSSASFNTSCSPANPPDTTSK
jgi:hypothetical protein